MMTPDQINAELERHITTFEGDQDYFDGYHDGLKWLRDTPQSQRGDTPQVYADGNSRYQEGFEFALFWIAYRDGQS